MKISREKAKERGYTHLATHRKSTSRIKKGDTVFCKYNEKTGEYSTSGMCCLLEPEENYDLEDL